MVQELKVQLVCFPSFLIGITLIVFGPLQLSVFRDPNSVETFKSFENCIDWAINGNFSDQDVDEAKLGVFSQVSVLSMINIFSIVT